MPPDNLPPELAKSSQDLADRAQHFRLMFLVGIPLLLFLCALEFWLVNRATIPGFLLLILLPANFFLVSRFLRLITSATHTAAAGLAQTVYGGGNLAPEPAFSAEESMIIQGRTEPAESLLRQRWRGTPPVYQAGMRLAELLVQLGRDEEAVAIFEELRRGALPPAVVMTVANRLIDLHHRSGNRHRLKVELARFASDYKGSGPGDHAARRLRELKDEDRRQDHGGED